VRSVQSWQMLSVPALALISALSVLVYGNLAHHRLTLAAVALAAATVLAAGAHVIATWRENLALLARTQRLSLTDPLTGLGNRRRLMADLLAACSGEGAGGIAPSRLALYDLDGFKRFNDTFGHPAGDALLVRLAERLRSAVEPGGAAYRMGGDEFCVLFECSDDDQDALIAASALALAERGCDFSITASHGLVRIPEEMSDPAAILQLADQRLYRRKAELAARRSGDAEECEHDLSLGERDGNALAGAASEQGAGDRRVRR
jgi:diguanylate cyclase (GGDEF)-like protein